MRFSVVLLVLCCAVGLWYVDAGSRNEEKRDEENDVGSGSGEDSAETISKVGNAKTKTTTATKSTHPHHHHHHHHHHHRHHHHHHAKKTIKKSDTTITETATSTKKKTSETGEKEPDSKLIKKTVGELAQTPLSKLMTLFKKGGVRTDIADQTIALLNASIINQNDLADIYKKEEVLDQRDKTDAPAGKKSGSLDDPTVMSMHNMTQTDLAEISKQQETVPNKKSKGAKGKASKKHGESGGGNAVDEKATTHDKQTVKEYDSMSLADQRRVDAKEDGEAKESKDGKDGKGDKKSGSQAKDKLEKSGDKKNRKTKKNEIMLDNKANVEYNIPSNIPSKCTKLVKNYANGEMTLKDYLKAMKLCKHNEEAAEKLADTTPAQREAVNTMSLIQHEAYKYAMESMRNFKSSSKDAESVMDQWRSNSFGHKQSLKKSEGMVPDAVKKFMTMQTPVMPGGVNAKLLKAGLLNAENALNPKNQTPLKPDMAKLALAKGIALTKAALLASANKNNIIKSNVATPNLTPNVVGDKNILVKKSALFQPMLKNGKVPMNMEEILAKKSLIPQMPLLNKELLAKKSLIAKNMFLPNSVLNANLLAKKSVIQQKMLIQQMISKGLIDKNGVLKNTAKFTIPHNKSPLNPANLPENIIEHPVPLPSEKTLIQADSTDKISPVDKKATIAKATIEKLPTVNKLTELDKVQPEKDNKLLMGGLTGTKESTVPSSLAAAVEKVKNIKDQKIPDISSSKILKELTGKDPLTPDKIAAEEFFASLANPVLDNMPVDTSLVAAFKGQNTDNILTDPGKLFQVSRRRRTLRHARVHHRHTIHSKSSKRSKRHGEKDTNEANQQHKQHQQRSKRNAEAKSKRSAHPQRTRSSPARHKRDIVLTLSKRDTTDNLTTSVKPIERSNMGVHISSNQGPKLLDKIRDMSRVIIH